jgi:hypothetical protein
MMWHDHLASLYAQQATTPFRGTERVGLSLGPPSLTILFSQVSSNETERTV